MSVDLTSLRSQKITQLVETALRLGLDNASNLQKQELVFEIVRRQPDSGLVRGAGVLEILPDGFGFLRSTDANYLPGSDDIYVSPSQIRRFNLRTGDLITGRVRAPKEGERYFALIKIETVNSRSPEVEREKLLFSNLTPVIPSRPLPTDDRPIFAGLDSAAPLAYGQRVVVVSGSGQERRVFLTSLIEVLPEEAVCMLLLVDARPEDVTALRREVSAEVIATTLDELPTRHVQVAEMAMERAQRVVEQGRDVVLMIDSITRLTRALYATSGRATPDLITSYQVRSLFSAGRQLEEGGSLTIIATASAGDDPGGTSLIEELRSAANAFVTLRDGQVDPEQSTARHTEHYVSSGDPAASHRDG
ncbi:MAG: Rho termination factor N-terminal domain-containing protein [Myxococcota bacterium]|nr:Rho termination factor N-terminal domain-containing protein [Myxococcota bacterium]